MPNVFKVRYGKFGIPATVPATAYSVLPAISVFTVHSSCPRYSVRRGTRYGMQVRRCYAPRTPPEGWYGR